MTDGRLIKFAERGRKKMKMLNGLKVYVPCVYGICRHAQQVAYRIYIHYRMSYTMLLMLSDVRCG